MLKTTMAYIAMLPLHLLLLSAIIASSEALVPSSTQLQPQPFWYRIALGKRGIGSTNGIDEMENDFGDGIPDMQRTQRFIFHKIPHHSRMYRIRPHPNSRMRTHTVKRSIKIPGDNIHILEQTYPDDLAIIIEEPELPKMKYNEDADKDYQNDVNNGNINAINAIDGIDQVDPGLFQEILERNGLDWESGSIPEPVSDIRNDEQELAPNLENNKNDLFREDMIKIGKRRNFVAESIAQKKQRTAEAVTAEIARRARNHRSRLAATPNGGTRTSGNAGFGSTVAALHAKVGGVVLPGILKSEVVDFDSSDDDDISTNREHNKGANGTEEGEVLGRTGGATRLTLSRAAFANHLSKLREKAMIRETMNKLRLSG